MNGLKVSLCSVNTDFVVYDVEGEIFGKIGVQFKHGVFANEIFFTHLPTKENDYNWHAFDKEEYFHFFIGIATSDYNKHN